MNNGRILVVDDEKDINDLLKDYLEMKGYAHITTLTRGTEALEFIKNDRPDLVFLDIKLEDDVDGMQVLEEGLAVSPGTKFVMMSAYKEEYGKKARDLGAYAFLDKPVQIHEIENVLKKAIRQGQT